MTAILLAALLAAGCSGLAAPKAAPAAVAPTPAPEYVGQGEEEKAAAREPETPQDGVLPEVSAASALDERMVIQTGEMVVRVEDVAATSAQVRALAQAYGGFVVNANTWTVNEEVHSTLTIRVPAERFDEMMDEIEVLATKVERSSITGEDVTEEYFDVEARLKVLRATEEQLLILLEDVRERMNEAEDIMAVYRELQNVQTRIEQLEGRQRYLERMVAMSTINLTLMPLEKEPPVISAAWQPLRTAKNAVRALSGTFQTLVDAAIWIVLYLLPVLLILAVPVALLLVVVRALVRRGRKADKANEERPADRGTDASG